MNRIIGLILMTPILLTYGCATTDFNDGITMGDGSVKSSSTNKTTPEDASGMGMGDTSSTIFTQDSNMQGDSSMGMGAEDMDPLDDSASTLSERTIYFEYDSSTISSKWQSILADHAAYLADHPTTRVTFEGHADERGTREYNIALGQHRANAVKQLVTLQGASMRQVNTVSYGEEKPFAEGNDDGAWRLNRRVEIIYTR